MSAGPSAAEGDPDLVALVRSAIDAAGGAISFADYMDLALFAPELGYYSAGTARFGADGDFVTAPESSSLFARCVARQTGEVLAGLGGGDVCEVGAGSGALAADLLEGLAEADSLPERYRIVERSPALRERQRSLLGSRDGALFERVEWCDEIPARIRGVVIGNEVLDAMPAHRFRMRAGTLNECRVASHDGGFRWVEADCAGSALARHAQSVLGTLDHALPDGYTSELAPARQAFIAHLGASLEQGVALLFDYGYPRDEYYHPQRSSGTLRCFHRHRAHEDPLILTGLQDISVHVDFTAIAEAAQAARSETAGGLDVAGFTTQAEFLLATGLLEACRDVDPTSRRHAELTAQIKRLTLPGQMGEAVKVMALARGFDEALKGFSGRDLRGRL
jgi:SAM-dependent MidA family methyltransferase